MTLQAQLVFIDRSTQGKKDRAEGLDLGGTSGCRLTGFSTFLVALLRHPAHQALSLCRIPLRLTSRREAGEPSDDSPIFPSLISSLLRIFHYYPSRLTSSRNASRLALALHL